jgi:hypothetical protein
LLNLQTEDPFGDKHTRRRLFEDPNRPMGVRDYHPEDEFRRIHWPATARTGQLQVKVYQPVSTQVMMVCLNVATFPHYWEGVYPALLEQLIKVTATLVYQNIQDGYSVGLVSNGCLAHADQPFHIPPGRSPRQLATLLQALAEVTPFITAPFEKYLLKSAPSIPYGATLILVKGERTFRVKMLLDPRFLGMTALVIALHAVWDYGKIQIVVWNIPVVPVALTVISWVILFAMMEKTAEQVTHMCHLLYVRYYMVCAWRWRCEDNDSLLFFFLLLVVIFCNCGMFDEDGDSLLFFFLLLVVLFCSCGEQRGERVNC